MPADSQGGGEPGPSRAARGAATAPGPYHFAAGAPCPPPRRYPPRRCAPVHVRANAGPFLGRSLLRAELLELRGRAGGRRGGGLRLAPHKLPALPDSALLALPGWATHGAETHFVFGTGVGADGCGPPNVLRNCSFAPAERKLARVRLPP